MANCCHGKEEALRDTVLNHKKVLWTVLLLNFSMFFVELYFGWISHSLALVGDSLDMLGDAITYASSIAVVWLGIAAKAKVAKLKAWIMLAFGLVIFGRCIAKFFNPTVPDFEFMFSIGLLALGVNLCCLFLLNKFKSDDINMRSVWICSRNDIIANVSVLCSALAVYYLNSGLPDLFVGIGLTVLFVQSAVGILRETKVTTCS